MIFCETHHFHDFAKRNRENDVSRKRIWGCVKSLLPPAPAEFSLDGDLFFMISRSEIMKNKSPSKYYLVRSAKKNLFTQP